METFVSPIDVLDTTAFLYGEPAALNMLILMEQGQRIGQAFMNSIDSASYFLLNGSTHNPFYKDSYQSVWGAIDYLTKGA